MKNDSGIKRIHEYSIDKKNIKNGDYTRTLVVEGNRVGVLTDDECYLINNSLNLKLGKLIQTYTDGESSSVKRQTASELMRSILYTIDIYLLSLRDDSAALDLLRAESLERLHENGIKLLQAYRFEAMSMLVKVRHNRLDISNVYYNDAIDIDCRDAIYNYDRLFFAHRVDNEIDYSLAVPAAGVGIVYIRNYLMKLNDENNFCRFFDQDAIKLLYMKYCGRIVGDIDDHHVNIYTIILQNAVMCEYLQKPAGSLIITDDECDVIQSLLESFDAQKCKDILLETASRINAGNREYNVKAFEGLIPGIINALNHEVLKNQIVVF